MRYIFWGSIAIVICVFLLALFVGSQAHSQPLPLQVASVKVVVEQPLVNSSAKAGDHLVIEAVPQGMDFGLQPGTVEVACVQAVVTSWGPGRVGFIVPTLPPSQQLVQVTVFRSDGHAYRSALIRIVP